MKVVHVVTKSGMERLTPLGENSNLMSWWGNTRMCGAIVGNTWCCPFDEIAFAEIIEANVQGAEDRAEDPATNATNRAIGALTSSITSGFWKPPSE